MLLACLFQDWHRPLFLRLALVKRRRYVGPTYLAVVGAPAVHARDIEGPPLRNQSQNAKIMPFIIMKRLLPAWLVLCCLLRVGARSTGASTPGTADTLLAFKDSFTNGGTVLANWTKGTDPCLDSWLGVFCDANGTGDVSMIQVAELGLQGTIPPDGFPLPNTLRILNLYDNEIQGSLPGLRWKLPPGLQVLSLFANQITGSIPEDWLPPSLTVLYLASNRISGQLPASWPPNMLQLMVNENRLQGSVPWGTLPATMIELWVDSNQLTGTLGTLPPGLQMLRASNNRLSGSIPVGAWLPSSLTGLYLSQNGLTGQLEGLALPAGLRTLELASNLLTGQLPASWAPPSSLMRLDLHGNDLSGSLPTWDGLSNTTAFIAPGNDGLCGEVPPSPLYSNSDTKQPVTSLQSCSAGSSSTGAIVGAVVGGVAALALAAALALWLLRRRKSQRPPAGGKVQEASSPKDLSNSSQQDDAQRQAELGAAEGTDAFLLASDPLLASITQRLQQLPAGAAPTPPYLATNGSNASGLRSPMSHPSSVSGFSIDVSRWAIPFKDLCLLKQIGRGSFGRVYVAKWKEAMVAVKLLLGEVATEGDINSAARQLLSMSRALRSTLTREANMMASLRHPNVLGFIGICFEPPILVSEYCSQGSLFSLLQRAKQSPELARRLSWPVRLKMAYGCALGMHYLHSLDPPVIHRDLKSPNILLDASWRVKIADFNLSKIMGDATLGICSSSSAAGNPRWLAPEVLQGQSHSTASDMFAYGLTLWEMLTWEAPWEGATNPWQVSSQIIGGQRPPIPSLEDLQRSPGGAPDDATAAAYIGLISRCWAQDPQERPCFADVIAALQAMLQAKGCGSLPNCSMSGSPPQEGSTLVVKEACAAEGIPADAAPAGRNDSGVNGGVYTGLPAGTVQHAKQAQQHAEQHAQRASFKGVRIPSLPTPVVSPQRSGPPSLSELMLHARGSPTGMSSSSEGSLR